MTSLDSIVRTFDIPSGRLIDAFRTATVATSISFSPTSDFLATAHVDSVGVYLWYVQHAAASARSDNTMTGRIGPSTRTSRSAAFPKRMSSVSTYHRCLARPKTKVSWKVHRSFTQSNIMFPVLDDLSAIVIYDQPEDNVVSMPGLEGEVVTLTHLPRSRWQTLLNLDVIQVSCFLFPVSPTRSLIWVISNETNQKSPRRLQRRHPFFCLLFRAPKHGLRSKRKKKRRHPRRSPKRPLHTQRVSSFKNCRKGPKIAIASALSTFEDRRLISLAR
jgi:hypothetical protein